MPAIIGVLEKIKLPYPSRAFDMAHGSRCLIPWGGNGEYSYFSRFLCAILCHGWFLSEL